LTVVLRSSERDGRALLREHQHIRTRLTEVGGAIERHVAGLATVQELVDELGAHERREDRILYLWEV